MMAHTATLASINTRIYKINLGGMSITSSYQFPIPSSCGSVGNGCTQIAQFGEISGEFGYFGVVVPQDDYWSSGAAHRLIKLRLSDMTLNGEYSLTGVTKPLSGVFLDSLHAYIFAPSKLAKVKLADMQEVTTVTKSSTQEIHSGITGCVYSL